MNSSKNHKSRRIIIPVETKSREFHGKLFLALNLLKKGYTVLFGEQARLWNYCDLLDHSVYLDKSVAATRAEWFKRCQEMGHLIISWDEEGLVFFENWMYRKLRVEPEAFDRVERFFAWGQHHLDAICEEYPDYGNKISICGNPRFDLMRRELRTFYQPEVDRLTEQFGPMILINTNFSFYNHYKDREELKSMLKRYPLADDPEYLEGWIGMHRDMHYAFLEMVPQMLSRYPEHSVVVRPHPSESHDPWLELAEVHPRLHIDASGNVHEWILASEAVIHFNCTTAIEAYLLEVPPIAFRPQRYPQYENKLPNGLSVNAFSLTELWDMIDGRKSLKGQGKLWNDEQNTMVHYYLSGLDDETSTTRICKEIDNLVQCWDTPPSNTTHKLTRLFKQKWRLLLHEWREMVNPSDGYAQQKLKGIDGQELEHTLKSMSELINLDINISVKFFAKNCYWLTPR